ncbi:hypothetical protein [Methylobacterium sp. AMS5]|uniref:hypothetical protein n=1 Tax=Methylobacterium sp. AMS5 TaxID=925818 RepID=UPI00074F8F0C|nr:hypothetical protein [Methylobacterium sp. AMS5]AMB48419.1 hypothetical protein Y590_25945 [Methylobacterium sp. AMS5]
MQPETHLTVTAEEADALARICDAQGISPANSGWALMGLRIAREQAPDIAAGKLGADPARLADSLRKARREGEREMRRSGATRAQVGAWAGGVEEAHAVATAALFTALEAARAGAFEAGQAMALDFLQRIGAEPDLVHVLPEAVEMAIAAGEEAGRAQGLSAAFVEAFRIAFFRGTDSVVRPFIDRLEEEERQAPARPSHVLVPGAAQRPSAPRRLRPEDFGALPSQPRP